MAKNKAASALDALRLALANADHALAAANAPEQKRIAVLLALKAVYDFSGLVGLKSRALNSLSMSLQDIERGHAAPLFAPSIQNRPRDAAQQFLLKATAAAAMQLYMNAGKTKGEASALVARGLSAKPETIARWRDKFSGHSAEEGSDIDNFVLEQAEALNTNPAQRASQTMQGLNRLAKNLDKPPS